MQDLYKDKHRTTSCRLKEYDYSQEGAYFITICCANRKSFFGEIVDGKMVLNELGKIAHDEWKNTEKIRKNITIDEFIIMPDHIHGIICIDWKMTNWGLGETPRRDTVHRVSTQSSHRIFNHSQSHHQSESFSKPTKNSIPTIIRSYKATVTKQINILRNTPECKIWQSKYFDRIIRDEAELHRIREYISLNPQKWEYDISRPENIYF